MKMVIEKEKILSFLYGKKRLLITSALLITAGAILLFALILGCFFHVKSFEKRVCSEVKNLPAFEYALLLGTAKRLKNGSLNLFFQYRMEAAALLYKKGRIRKIIVSGDNSRKDYNEVKDMQETLLAMGVPEKAIFPDYAGFRTLDSICRAKSLYKAEKILIISQHFHCRRALFLADHFGVEARGFAAKDVPLRICWKMVIREPLACVKACLDLWLLKTKPKFAK